MVVGKGGVGKTTIAGALGLSMEPPLLTFSLDPLPNLCAAVGTRCSFEPTEFERGRYFGEVNYETAKELWVKRFGKDLEEAVKDALGIDDVKGLVEHVASAPGLAEQFTLLFVLEKAKTLGVSKVILDLPPLGPTIHMIKAEREFYEHLLSAAKVYKRISNLLRLRGSKALSIIDEWRKIAEYVLNEISNSKYVLVSTPERFPREIALKGAEELEKFGIKHWRSYLNKAREPGCLKRPTYVIPELPAEPIGASALMGMIRAARRAC